MNRFHTHFTDIVSHDILFKDNFLNVMQLPKIASVTLNIGLGKKAVIDKKQVLTSLTVLELITEQKACITRSKKSIDKFKLRENMPLGSKVTLRHKKLFNFFDNLTNFVLPSLDEFLSNDADALMHQHPPKNSFFISPNSSLSYRFFYFDPLINKHLSTCYQKKQFDSVNFFLFQHNLVYPSKKFECISLNYGIHDILAFKEIPYDKLDTSYGLDMTFHISYSNKKKMSHLYKPNYILTAFQFPLSTSNAF